MAGQIKERWLVIAGALVALVVGCATVAAQQPIRLSRNIPGDSKPIVLHADNITTWTDGGQRIILLKGKVLVEQGVLNLRAQQAVIWVDEGRWKQTHIYHVDFYAEGAVHLENGPVSEHGPTAVVDLNTRGELKMRAQASKIVQQTRLDDPLFVRAKTTRFPQEVITPASNIQQTSGQQPTTPGPPGATLIPTQAPSPQPAPEPQPPAFDATPPPPSWPAETPTPATTSPAPAPVTAGPALPVIPPGGPPPTPVPNTTANPLAGPRDGPPRVLSIAPRTGAPFQTQSFPLPTGEQAVVVTGGVILTVRNVASVGLVDIEADRLVFWTRGNANDMLQNLKGEGQTSRELEFFLAGNVEIRQQSRQSVRTLRAEQIYYDVSRNVAVAVSADLEVRQPGVPDPIHLKADELYQLSPTLFRGVRAEVFASRLPSDPGLKVFVQEATLEEKRLPKKTLFGRQLVDPKTGQPETYPESLFHGTNIFVKVEDVPVFWFPFLQGDARDPLGPLESIRFNNDRIFGTQIYTTFNVYDLLGLDPRPGTRWRADVDYLSRRGPALGTEYNYAGKDLLSIPSQYAGLVKAYGIDDTGKDILGGGRGEFDHHPEWRGRFLWRQNWWDLPGDFTLQFQASVLSDKNFLEQYYKYEFDSDINQETFVYLKQQRDNWAWTVLAEPRIRNWVTETEWLPRADGYLIGESFFNLFTYDVHASAGYAQLMPTTVPPPPVTITDQRVNTGRFDLWQELSLPFTLGPLRLVPYLAGDLTYYTEDLTGNDRGRVYGAAGIRGSIPFTRLYPDVCCDLLNLNGINHKIVLSANFYAADSDTPYERLPQLDRLDDDATDQARRDITPRQPFLHPGGLGLFLLDQTIDPHGLYNLQFYSIRRLVDDRIDTLDSVEVLQVDLRQRWQTKRGYPGMQHIVDWMTLDLSGSYFPHTNRDNFGEDLAFLEYDWTWNIGDRTALVSSGWFDPIDNGARVWNVGAFLNRPDRTNFFLGYRQIDPIGSKAVSGAVTYIFSPKYAMTAASTYDFGINQAGSLSNSLVLTRMGSDLQVSLGVTYNAILNNFGVTFEIIPNLAAQSRRLGSMGHALVGR